MGKEKQDYQERQELPEKQETPEPSEDRKPQEQQEQPMPKTELWAEGFQNLRNIRFDMPLVRILIIGGLLFYYYNLFRRPRIDMGEYWEELTLLILYLLVRFSPVNREVFKNKYTKIIWFAILIGPFIGIYFWRFLLSN